MSYTFLSFKLKRKLCHRPKHHYLPEHEKAGRAPRAAGPAAWRSVKQQLHPDPDENRPGLGTALQCRSAMSFGEWPGR